jgi:lipoprotein signal peptidase
VTSGREGDLRCRSGEPAVSCVSQISAFLSTQNQGAVFSSTQMMLEFLAGFFAFVVIFVRILVACVICARVSMVP